MADLSQLDYCMDLDGFYYWISGSQEGNGPWIAFANFKTVCSDGELGDQALRLPGEFATKVEAMDAASGFAEGLIKTRAIQAICPAVYRKDEEPKG